MDRLFNKTFDGLRRELFVVAVVGFLLGYSWFFTGVTSPNERSRIFLSVALVDHGTVSVEKPVERFGAPLDIARYDGEYRSDKAPGASYLGAVVYSTVRLFSAPEDWGITDLLQLMRFGLMIPIALFGFMLLRGLLRRTGLDPPVVDVTSLAWILGTSAFHYSSAFFGHQIAAVGLVGAFAGIISAESWLSDDESTARWLACAGGAAAGVAGMTEYPAAIPCVVTLGFAIARLWPSDKLSVVAYAAGAAPFVILLFGYHYLAFGGWFELPYFHLVNETFSDVHSSGIAGFKWPSWEWFYGGVFSLHRGLLGTSPFFAVVLPGGYWLWREKRWGLLIAALSIFVYYLLLISAWPLWEGGWGYGPRHLVAMMGVGSILVGTGLQFLRGHPVLEGLSRGLIVLSIIGHQAVAAFFAELPQEHANPLMDGIYQMWQAGIAGPNIISLISGYTGLWSLAPLAVLVMLVGGLIGLRGYRGWRNAVLAGMLTVFTSLAGLYGISVRGETIDNSRQDEFVDYVLGLRSTD